MVSQVSKQLCGAALPLLYETLVVKYEDSVRLLQKQASLVHGSLKWAHCIKDISFEAPSFTGIAGDVSIRQRAPSKSLGELTWRSNTSPVW